MPTPVRSIPRATPPATTVRRDRAERDIRTSKSRCERFTIEALIMELTYTARRATRGRLVLVGQDLAIGAEPRPAARCLSRQPPRDADRVRGDDQVVVVVPGPRVEGPGAGEQHQPTLDRAVEDVGARRQGALVDLRVGPHDIPLHEPGAPQLDPVAGPRVEELGEEAHAALTRVDVTGEDHAAVHLTRERPADPPAGHPRVGRQLQHSPGSGVDALHRRRHPTLRGQPDALGGEGEPLAGRGTAHPGWRRGGGRAGGQRRRSAGRDGR